MSLPISGFTAVPNPQMLAFMAAQSFVMMMQAGEGWQYGKRKQSAMTNEEFNKQTPLSIMQRQMSELKSAIPTIEQSMNAMTPMIRTIVIQYGDFMKEIIRALPAALTAAQGGQTLTGNISTVGQELADILKNLIPNIPQASADTGTISKSNKILVNLEENFSGSELATSQNQIEFNKRQAEAEAAAAEKARASIPSKKTLSIAADDEWKTWSAKLGQLKVQFQKIEKERNLASQYRANTSLAQNRTRQATITRLNNQLFTITSQIRAMSNDYRNPNNNIRENAIRLRQALAAGKWKR